MGVPEFRLALSAGRYRVAIGLRRFYSCFLLLGDDLTESMIRYFDEILQQKEICLYLIRQFDRKIE